MDTLHINPSNVSIFHSIKKKISSLLVQKPTVAFSILKSANTKQPEYDVLITDDWRGGNYYILELREADNGSEQTAVSVTISSVKGIDQNGIPIKGPKIESLSRLHTDENVFIIDFNQWIDNNFFRSLKPTLKQHV